METDEKALFHFEDVIKGRNEIRVAFFSLKSVSSDWKIVKQKRKREN